MQDKDAKSKTDDPQPDSKIYELTERNYFDTNERRVIYRRVTNVAGRFIRDGYCGICTVRIQLPDGRVATKEGQFAINATSVNEAFVYFKRDLEEYEKNMQEKASEELARPALVDAAGMPIRSKSRPVIGGDGRTSRHGGNNGKIEGE